MRFASYVMMGILTPLSGCSEKQVGETEVISFAGGTIEKQVSASGPAFGGSQYFRLFAVDEGNRFMFFEGENFAEFKLDSNGEKLRIQLCLGEISKAQSFLLRGDLKRLDIDWNCKGEMQEYE